MVLLVLLSLLQSYITSTPSRMFKQPFIGWLCSQSAAHKLHEVESLFESDRIETLRCAC